MRFKLGCWTERRARGGAWGRRGVSRNSNNPILVLRNPTHLSLVTPGNSDTTTWRHKQEVRKITCLEAARWHDCRAQPSFTNVKLCSQLACCYHNSAQRTSRGHCGWHSTQMLLVPGYDQSLYTSCSGFCTGSSSPAGRAPDSERVNGGKKKNTQAGLLFSSEQIILPITC